jgi:hypothetical protein
MSTKRLSFSLALLSLLSYACKAQSNPQAGLQLNQNQSQPLDASTQSCVQAADFCVSPSVQSPESADFAACSKLPQTLQKNQFSAFCFDPFTGLPIPGVTIQLTVKAEDQTGGHLHTDPGRPHGDFNPASGLVDPTTNVLQTVYTSPDTAGIVDATVSGTLSDGVTQCTPTIVRLGVETHGLAAIPFSGSGYGTEPSTGHDSNNVFANPSVGTNLQRLPVSFDILAQALISAGFVSSQPIPTLTYLSLSLPFGGVFDVDTNGTGHIDSPWHPPHCGHRNGTQADLRIKNVPAELRPALVQSILDSHFIMPVKKENPSFPTASHWHLQAH